ncbi:MAG: tail fiber domain-containing protein [Saprospiraceae bacterium]|nr:tail fiber domain-containing protein [Saprospiraceae bacterium]
MKQFILFCIILLNSTILPSQNVGINTTTPTENLHIRADSSKVAIRYDNKKSVENGVNYFTVTGTPSSVSNFQINPSYINWTDFNAAKLVNSDNTALNSPILNIYPEVANQARIFFDFDTDIPSTANITNMTLHAEWKRIGSATGELRITSIWMQQAANNQILLSFGNFTKITSSTDVVVALPFKEVITPVTPDMLNLNDFFISLTNLHSIAQGSSRLEIDKMWLEVEYNVPSEGTENVYWTSGVKEGNYQITNSEDLNSNEYLKIDETGVTQLKGLKIAANAGPNKFLTSSSDGMASWADLPIQSEVLWIDKNDTAAYASGPIQIHNATGQTAVLFDKGENRLNNGINFAETDNRQFNVLIDANNDQINEQFNIYKDSTQFNAENPAIRFQLDDGTSYFNTAGNLGLGTTNPNAAALLHLSSSDKGILIPKMTTGEKEAINSPPSGLMVFDTDLQLFSFFSGGDWNSINALWAQNQDTAYYNAGPVQIDNNATDAALVFDKGESRLNNGINMIETENRLLNVILDADNDQGNEAFSLFKDSTEFAGQNAAIRFQLDGGDSWINTKGNFIVGSDELPGESPLLDSLFFYDVAQAALRVGVLDNSEDWSPSNIGHASFAAGLNTRAFGSSSVATGENTTASGDATTACGWFSTASGLYATALGENTAAVSRTCTAMGDNTRAAGINSTAMGSFTVAKGYASTVIGVFNDSIYNLSQTTPNPTTPLFIIGNGDSDASRSNAMVVTKDGQIGLDLNSPSTPIHHGNGARLTAAGVWSNSSDRRLKSDIQPIAYGLQEVMRLSPSKYIVNSTGEESIGFIAQELKEIIPEVVHGKEGEISKGETLSVAYGNLVAVLTKAVQELALQSKDHKEAMDEKDIRINQLEAKIKKMEGLAARVEALEKVFTATNSKEVND